MSGPSIDRAHSSGDIWTPVAFREAVVKKFGLPYFDLACSAKNMFASHGGYTEQVDSLGQEWHKIDGLLWLNPPFSNITPWARKCSREAERGAVILLLVPASIGANWYWDYVEPYADVYSVGRMVFDNCFSRKTGKLVTTTYPKDLILCHYVPQGFGPPLPMQRWRWENDS